MQAVQYCTVPVLEYVPVSGKKYSIAGVVSLHDRSDMARTDLSPYAPGIPVIGYLFPAMNALTHHACKTAVQEEEKGQRADRVPTRV